MGAPPEGFVVPPELPLDVLVFDTGGFVFIEFEVFAFSLTAFVFPFAFASRLLFALLAASSHTCKPSTDIKTAANKNILIIIPSPPF